ITGWNHDHIVAVAFSLDGKWLHGSTMGGGILVRCTQTGKTMYHESGELATHLIPDPDGGLMFVRTRFGAVRLIDAVWPPQPEVFDTGAGRQYVLAFSLDGTQVAVGGQQKEMRIVDATRLREITRLSVPSEVFALAYALDGKTLAAGGA